MEEEMQSPMVMVEVYLGPAFRTPEGKRDAYRKIDRIWNECCLTTGGSESCERFGYKCDIIYGVLHQRDIRTKRFAEKLNGLEGICARVRPADPRTGRPLPR